MLGVLKHLRQIDPADAVGVQDDQGWFGCAGDGRHLDVVDGSVDILDVNPQSSAFTFESCAA